MGDEILLEEDLAIVLISNCFSKLVDFFFKFGLVSHFS
jgi:hypothetical protein